MFSVRPKWGRRRRGLGVEGSCFGNPGEARRTARHRHWPSWQWHFPCKSSTRKFIASSKRDRVGGVGSWIGVCSTWNMDSCDQWQRFHRALRQRNAALKAGQPRSLVSTWDPEFARLGESIQRGPTALHRPPQCQRCGNRPESAGRGVGSRLSIRLATGSELGGSPGAQLAS